MDFKEHTNLKIVEVQEKYKNLKSTFIQHIENLRSSSYQLKVAGKEIESFVNQVIQSLSKIPDENNQMKLELLANAVNQIKDYIDDRPSVIQFELEKYTAMISLLDDFNNSGELIKNSFDIEEKKLDRIQEEIEDGKSDKDLTKRKKAGRKGRVEKIRDVRNAQSRSKKSTTKKTTRKKRNKKSVSK